MTCNICNMLIKEKDRYYPCDSAYLEDDEICYVYYDETADRYDLIFSYDSGYCYGRIKDIHFCPLCGRELRKVVDNNAPVRNLDRGVTTTNQEEAE